MQKFTWILQLSRPRFWFYLLGPFLLGIAAYPLLQIDGSNGNFQAGLLAAILFFTLPANLLIYGLNDLFDYETDKHNPKKKSYETLLAPEQRSQFLTISGFIIIPFLLLLLFTLLFNISLTGNLQITYSPNSVALWSLAAFLFFGIGYSAPPIRAKTKPFIDTFFNILYIFPGLVAYGILTGQFPPLAIIAAATLWCMAMHAFSAIPDIAADKKANLATVATALGANKTLFFCTICYVVCAILTFPYIGVWSLVGLLLYGKMMCMGYASKNNEELFKVYKAFPYVNIAFGFVLFWAVLLITRSIIY